MHTAFSGTPSLGYGVTRAYGICYKFTNTLSVENLNFIII